MATETTQAETIFKEFREHSVAEFFKKNRQMLGYSGKIRSLTTIIHEYVTNSLDACEDAQILPDILVKIEQLGQDHYKVTVKDNGPGIPKEHIGKVFAMMLAGTKFHRFVQARGQQGIGASGCTMYAQITTGKPVRVTTSTGNGKAYEADIMIDVKGNKPSISNEREFDYSSRGTTVVGQFRDVQFNRSEYGPGEYLRRTALANPHAKITFIDPDKRKVVYTRAVTKMPKKNKESKPHPSGITIDDLMGYAHISKERTLQSFFVKTFDRMSNAKAKEVEELTSIDFKRKPDSISWGDADEIVSAIKKVKFLAPSTKELQPIGEKQIEKAFLNVLDPKFHSVLSRKPAVYHGGIPFLVEVGIAYGGKAGRGEGENVKTELLRFANRSPLLFDTGACVTSKVVNNLDWKRYGLKKLDTLPLSIFINVVSTYIPYTSAGKQAIADVEEVNKEVNLALMECGRRIAQFIRSEKRKYEKHAKRSTLLRYIPEIARALEELSGEKRENTEKLLVDLVETRFNEIVDEPDEETGEGEETLDDKEEGGDE